MGRTYSVKQIIAIRKKGEAKAAAGGAVAKVAVGAGAEGAKPAKEKTPRLVVTKGVSFEGDAGMIPLVVSKGELGAALGIEGARGPADRGAALATIAAAVAQPTYLREGANVTRLEARVRGVEGLSALLADFGGGQLRRLWVDGAAVDAMALADGDGSVAGAFELLRGVSAVRQAARDKRFDAIKAGKAAREAAAVAPDMAEAA